jgi:cyclic beta-1,2-glucan synthetase
VIAVKEPRTTNFSDQHALVKSLSATIDRFGHGLSMPQEEEAPFRSELFSADQMERHGKILATAHKISSMYHEDTLLARLDDNEAILGRTRKRLTDAVQAGTRITPAGEWLLDNFYLMEEQIRATRRHLPKGYSRELPRLANGTTVGLPRVYDIALATISCGDGRVDLDSLNRFVEKYQTVAPLKLGELWAIPIMLRLALIENLRRVAVAIANGMANRDLAGIWADKMVLTADKDPKSLILVIADMARSNPPMVGSFVSELARRLQWQSPALAMPLTWIEQRLAEGGLTIEQLIQSETQTQASNQVSISNSIGSLRLLGAVDWSIFVEQQSLVNHTLEEDPSSIYKRMNFATRDRYRHFVEKIAKDSKLGESEVAKTAVQLASKAAQQLGPDNRQAHVGYYLVDKGRSILLGSAGVSSPIGYKMSAFAKTWAIYLYLGAVLCITAFVSAHCWDVLHSAAIAPALKGLSLAAAIAVSSQLAFEITNWLAMMFNRPAHLPCMNFETGIPGSAVSLVVVPTMITSPGGVEHLIEALEVRYLANQDKNLYFALLTDFADAQSEVTDSDAALLQMAKEGIIDLNQKYHNREKRVGDPFFLLHRPRIFNQSAGCWMGRERKRGKLADLNLLLRGRGEDHFAAIVGTKEILEHVKYVITLDTDTQLPRDSARHLVEAMEHPLNQPRIDVNKKVIVDGYGLLQPRLSNSLSGARRSLFSLLHCGEVGIDPYTRVVSDIYQDLFEEGSFIGKGIYNVDAFEAALLDRFPDNRILSHDLLEGCYVRSGLISDVQFYEEYPSTYMADVSRRHRWIRGDWQIIDWLLPAVPSGPSSPSGKSAANPLSLLSRFKIFDNLRRSLTAPATVALLILGWTVLSPRWLWTGLGLIIIFLPPLISFLSQLLLKPKEISLRRHLADTVSTAAVNFLQALFSFACLPFEAYFSLDAISRTCYRILISKKNLLVWQASTAPDRQKSVGTGLWVKMLTAPSIASAVFLFLLLERPQAISIAAPALLLWFFSPAIASLISRPLPLAKSELTAEQTAFLNKLARKTWAFFEMLVVEGDNFLPPDNYQLQPVEAIAHRTSPTNMGLALLSNLTAYDFGFICLGQLLDRTDRAVKSMSALERYRGHFYNWYDTETLKPLLPLYISTVDSGNLAGHLLTLRMGLVDLGDRKIISASVLSGLSTTVAVLRDVLPQTLVEEGALNTFASNLQKCVETGTTDAGKTGLTALWQSLDSLHGQALEIVHALSRQFEYKEEGNQIDEARWWADSLTTQCASALEDLTYLCPWLVSENRSQVLQHFPELDKVPTLAALSQVTASLNGELSDLPKLRSLLDLSRKRAEDRLAQFSELVDKLETLAQMDFTFLYDKTRHLLSIGYNVEERRLDNSFYDLLASEARLGNFVAIAQGQLPEESWFALGRLLMGSDAQPVLCSWSGSMFEYLMPLLVMPTFEHTLLDQTYKSVVAKQIEYGVLRNVPWGISESGYNSFDAHLNYQYRAFGVPGLGLKRGLADDLVIAPYASVMALMVAPEKAYFNLKDLSTQGLVGKLGFFEAIDCTPRRMATRQLYAVVKSFMAHHQGMSLLSLGYALLDKPLQKCFEKDPAFKATIPLLQERIPKSVVVQTESDGLSNLTTTLEAQESPVRVLKTPNTTSPEVQLLSNGRYNVMISNSGGGYSRWKDMAITRWRPDTTLDNWGTFCYVKEVGKESYWSAAYQPAQVPSDHFEAIFSEARVEFRRRDGDLDTHYEIVVSSEDDIELRRVQLTNRSRTRKVIELTSYAEVVLTSADTDAMHPAFSNLFVQTEIIQNQKAILCNRRPRSASDQEPWMFHLMVVHGAEVLDSSYETDRSRFLGRGNTPHNPSALDVEGPLSNTDGSVLDPIVAARSRIVIEPHASATINIVTGVAETKEACLALVERYKDKRLADRVFEVSWTHNQVVLRQINASDADAQLYGRLAGSIVYPNAAFRADATTLIKNRRGQSSLWGYAISGDLPIVLVQIRNSDNLEIVRQLVQAHAYWRLKGLVVDLVIWNEDHGGYRQALQEQILGIIAVGVVANVIDRPGGIFVRVAEQISAEDRILFQSVARTIISDNRGSLEEQILSRPLKEARVPLLVPSKAPQEERPPQAIGSAARELVLGNGLGGFTPDGREYVITLTPGVATPAPWSNVIANPYFGAVISESGASYTWAENAHEYRLTPWHDDPVSDLSGEAYYIRDEETGKFWSPTPFPCYPAGHMRQPPWIWIQRL